MKTQKSSPRNISCDEAIKRIFSYIDDHLQGKSRVELEHHLETCRHCFDRVEFEKLLKSRLSKLHLNPSSGELRKKVEDLVDRF